MAKSIQKAIKKDGITGFEVQKGETSISELVPTDFYEEEIIAASKAIGKVTNIAEDSHELVRYHSRCMYFCLVVPAITSSL